MSTTTIEVSGCDSRGVACEKNGKQAAEARARGKELRLAVPRSAHATWNAGGRANPIETLQAATAGCLEHLIPIRFGRMLESPLAFLRGVPLLMARDLVRTPRSGISVQACGDAHLMNFGLFASPERNLLFDINDFDETLTGPWEWDVKRLAASLALASRENKLRETERADCIRNCAQSYCEQIYRYSRRSLLDVWYSRIDDGTIFEVFRDKERQRLAAVIDQAHKSNHEQAVAKLTKDEAGHLQFKENSPLTTHAKELLSDARLARILSSYRESLQDDRRHLFDGYRVIDRALKVVGVSSVGTRCFVALMGSDHKNDCLMLQIKEATPSILEGLTGPAWHGNQGERTVTGQRLIQGFSDIFLGWGTDGERDYYVRQLRDMKGQIIPATSSAERLCDYARLCGRVLARAHSRSGDAAHISGYLGKSDVFDEAIDKFAARYADQTERDFESFKGAVRLGRLPAERGI